MRRRGLRRNGEKMDTPFRTKLEKSFKTRDPEEEPQFFGRSMSAAERQRLIDLRDRLIEEYRKRLRY